MNRCIVMAVAAVMLAAGGAARAAEKEAPIDWPARAATVKVGMTRAEVEKIMPKWIPECGMHRCYIKPETKKPSLFSKGIDPGRDFHQTNLSTNTLMLRTGSWPKGGAIRLGSRGPGWFAETYQLSDDWVVTVNYDDKDNKGIKRYSGENQLVAPVKIETLDNLLSPKEPTR